MRTVTSERKVRQGARLGKILTFGSLGLLLAGLIVAWRMQTSPLLWLSLVCLLVGIGAASVGLGYMNRWVRQPRADQVLDQALKGFDDRYRLYNYVLPAPHVLLTPSGLYVLTAMGQDGVIRYEGGRFRRNFSVGRVLRFLGEEGLGKPFVEGDAQVRGLQRFLQKHGAGEGADIQNVIVFYNPRADVTVTEPPRPVVAPKGLKRAIRKPVEGKLLPAQYRQLQDLFERYTE